MKVQIKQVGVERIINTLSNDFVKRYDVELISLYKSNIETYFKYDDNIKQIIYTIKGIWYPKNIKK